MTWRQCSNQMTDNNSKLGIFDSGLGGLVTLRAIRRLLPQYDYIYFGDTKHVPYGNRSQVEIKKLTIEALEFLFAQNCSLVIIACNTASAKALRSLQTSWLPKYYPDKKVLGVIVPTIETASKDKKRQRIGLIATASTVRSKVYEHELNKINPSQQVVALPAPLLVPLIESNRIFAAEREAILLVQKIMASNTTTLILGCTHYAIIKQKLRKAFPQLTVISQDEIVPLKLKAYLRKHPEIRHGLSQHGSVNLYVSKTSTAARMHANKWFGKTKLQLVQNKKQ